MNLFFARKSHSRASLGWSVPSLEPTHGTTPPPAQVPCPATREVQFSVLTPRILTPLQWSFRQNPRFEMSASLQRLIGRLSPTITDHRLSPTITDDRSIITWRKNILERFGSFFTSSAFPSSAAPNARSPASGCIAWFAIHGLGFRMWESGIWDSGLGFQGVCSGIMRKVASRLREYNPLRVQGSGFLLWVHLPPTSSA